MIRAPGHWVEKECVVREQQDSRRIDELVEVQILFGDLEQNCAGAVVIEARVSMVKGCNARSRSLDIFLPEGDFDYCLGVKGVGR